MRFVEEIFNALSSPEGTRPEKNEVLRREE